MTTDYTKMLMEMRTYDLSDRKILTSFDEFSKWYENVSKEIKYDEKTDPNRFYKHNAKRHEIFKHEIFGNNFRMFGLEDKFDIGNMK